MMMMMMMMMSMHACMQLAMLLDSCKLAIKRLKKWMSPEKVCVSFASRVSVFLPWI
jgi:hypothetical protein